MIVPLNIVSQKDSCVEVGLDFNLAVATNLLRLMLSDLVQILLLIS